MRCPTRKSELHKNFEESLRRDPPAEVHARQQEIASLVNAERAAVGLLVSYRSDSDEIDRFLLTCRSTKLKSHPGQVALPGGLVEESDRSLVETLKREFFEEVGILPDSVEWLVDFWDPLFSINRVKAYPFLGFLDLSKKTSNLTIDPVEVAEAEWIDFRQLFDPSLWSIQEHQRKNPINGQLALEKLPQWSGWRHPTWGLTAYFLALFVRRISGQAPY